MTISFNPFQIEGLSDEFEAVLELHDQVDRRLREAFKDSKVAYIFQIASDAELSREENVVIMKLLTDEIIEQTAAENSGYHAVLTHASHVFTQVLQQTESIFSDFSRNSSSRKPLTTGNGFAGTLKALFSLSDYHGKLSRLQPGGEHRRQPLRDAGEEVFRANQR